MDLAARNVLLGENNLAKVADFGLTRDLHGKKEQVVKDKNIKLAIKWMAVEVLAERKFSAASDMWSCAITIWELLTYGELPYKGMNNADTQRYIAKGLRMEMPANCPAGLWELITSAWDQKPERRLSFQKLTSELKILAAKNKPPTARDIGAMLTDPEVEKQAKAAQIEAAAVRKVQAEEETRRRSELSAEALTQKHLWFHPNVPAKIAEKAIKKNGQGCYLVREEVKGRQMVLMVNENDTVTSFNIRVDPSSSRPGAFRYTFAGRPHTTLEAIVANLKAAPFKGKAGGPLALSDPCPLPMKKGAQAPPAAMTEGARKTNPLFSE
jgi:serine/threonine protein kinase